MLFFAGTRDQLCDLQLLRQALSKADHAMKVKLFLCGSFSSSTQRLIAEFCDEDWFYPIFLAELPQI